MLHKANLWQNIAAYELDDPAAEVPFSARVARDNAWTQEQADNAILEYKKFIYLCAISPLELTPSDEIEQVWQMHLIFTRDYWGPFSRTVRKEIHHGPTRGGIEENAPFLSSYSDTRKLYEREFGVTPPAEVWPEYGMRDSASRFFIRIDPRSFLIFERPMIVTITFLILLVCTAILCWGIGYLQFQSGMIAKVGWSEIFPDPWKSFGQFALYLSVFLSIGFPLLCFAIFILLAPDWYQNNPSRNPEATRFP